MVSMVTASASVSTSEGGSYKKAWLATKGYTPLGMNGIALERSGYRAFGYGGYPAYIQPFASKRDRENIDLSVLPTTVGCALHAQEVMPRIVITCGPPSVWPPVHPPPQHRPWYAAMLTRRPIRLHTRVDSSLPRLV